jgi:hypothetical protein
MTVIAYALLQRRRLAHAGWKKINGLKPADNAPRSHRAYRSAIASAMPALQKTNRRKSTGVNNSAA